MGQCQDQRFHGPLLLSECTPKDNWDFARRIHLRILALMAYQPTLDAYVAVEKYLLVKQGIFTSTRQRGPVGMHLTTGDKIEIDKCFDALRTTVDAE